VVSLTSLSKKTQKILFKGISQDEIKKHFKKMAIKLHPDKNPGDERAADRFKELQEAYATLGNKWKRAIYDQDMR
jgi:DnaJ-class molecular chaperone